MRAFIWSKGGPPVEEDRNSGVQLVLNWNLGSCFEMREVALTGLTVLGSVLSIPGALFH